MKEREKLKREQGVQGEEELITVKIYGENAFNNCSRASIVTGFL